MKIFFIILIILSVKINLNKCDDTHQSTSPDMDWIDFLSNYRDRYRTNPLETLKRINQLKKMIAKSDTFKKWLIESINMGKLNENNASLDESSDNNERQQHIPKHVKIYFKNLFAKLKKVPFKWG